MKVMPKKIKKVTFAVLLVILISIINTLKGAIIIECGYKFQFWIAESLSLLLTFGLLYYLLYVKDTNCTTVINNNIKK